MTWNPFDWTAGPFLSLYLALAVMVFAWGFGIKSRIGPAMLDTHRLNPLEMAYLADGARRLGDVLLLKLVAAHGATIDEKKHKITVTDRIALEMMAGRQAMPTIQPDMTRPQFQSAIAPVGQRLQGRLRELGYCPTAEQMRSFRAAVLPFVGLLLAFGVVKAWLGSERHHPIGFLTVLLVFTLFGGLLLSKAPLRTRAGDQVLRTYQDRHARASRAPLDDELVLAVALTGAAVLTGTAYAAIHATSQKLSSDGGGGGCSGGGCGGGGCGGCS